MQLVQFILSHYPEDCQPEEFQSLGTAGGFSGAMFWKISSRRGTLCLRRWPKEHPDQNRIEFLHHLLRYVFNEGFSLVPLPIALKTDSNRTYLKHQGNLWELTPWMPGVADYLQSRSTEKLEAALQALAAFHQAASNKSSKASLGWFMQGSKQLCVYLLRILIFICFFC